MNLPSALRARNWLAYQREWQRCVRLWGPNIQRALALVGLLTIIGVMLFWPRILVHAEQGRASAFGVIRNSGISLFEFAVDSEGIGQRAVAANVARRYRIASDMAEQLVLTAFSAGQRFGLDPLLIVAVIAVESRFNPIAESEMGAKGLMQIIPAQHQDKLLSLGGDDALFDPQANITVGAQILKDCMRRAGGVAPGLQLYAGASADSSNQYAQRILAEKDRLKAALSRAAALPLAEPRGKSV